MHPFRLLLALLFLSCAPRSAVILLSGSRSRSRLAPFSLRGDSPVYKNKTAAAAAAAVGARAPWRAPKLVWKMAWEVGRNGMAILHKPYVTRGYVPNDTNVNLSVLYWKAIDGDEVARAMLPGTLGRMLTSRRVRFMFPRLHHSNVGIRTRCINNFLEGALRDAREARTTVKVIILGAGFDSRGIHLLADESNEGVIDGVVEFDLPSVTSQKGFVIERNFLPRRRRRAGGGGGVSTLPTLKSIDLNNIGELKDSLRIEINRSSNNNNNSSNNNNDNGKKIIVIIEAVLIYLEDPVATLSALADVLSPGDRFIFADRLPRDSVPYGDFEAAEAFFRSVGFGRSSLRDFIPKPGLASSMGEVVVT